VENFFGVLWILLGKKYFLLAFSHEGDIIDSENVFANVFISCDYARAGGSE
jgi:hypothetical protein